MFRRVGICMPSCRVRITQAVRLYSSATRDEIISDAIDSRAIVFNLHFAFYIVQYSRCSCASVLGVVAEPKNTYLLFMI